MNDVYAFVFVLVLLTPVIAVFAALVAIFDGSVAPASRVARLFVGPIAALVSLGAAILLVDASVVRIRGADCILPFAIAAAVGLFVSVGRARLWWWPELRVVREPIAGAFASLIVWMRAIARRAADAIHAGTSDVSSMPEPVSKRRALVRKVTFVGAAVVLVAACVVPRIVSLAPSRGPSTRFGSGGEDLAATITGVAYGLLVTVMLVVLIVWFFRPMLAMLGGRRSRRATGIAALVATTLAAGLTSLTFVRPSIERSIAWLPVSFDVTTGEVAASAGPMPLYVSSGATPFREVGMDDGGHGGTESFGRSRREIDRDRAFRYVGDRATVHDIGQFVGFACLGAECALGRVFVVCCENAPEGVCDTDPSDDFAVVAGPDVTFRRGARLVGRATPSGSVVEVDGRAFATRWSFGRAQTPAWWNPAPTRASRMMAWAAALVLALAALAGVRSSMPEAIVYGLVGAAVGVREAFPGFLVVVVVVLASARWLGPAIYRFVARRPDPA